MRHTYIVEHNKEYVVKLHTAEGNLPTMTMLFRDRYEHRLVNISSEGKVLFPKDLSIFTDNQISIINRSRGVLLKIVLTGKLPINCIDCNKFIPIQELRRNTVYLANDGNLVFYVGYGEFGARSSLNWCCFTTYSDIEEKLRLGDNYISIDDLKLKRFSETYDNFDFVAVVREYPEHITNYELSRGYILPFKEAEQI